MVPITEDAVNDGAQVELGTKSVQHHSEIDARSSEGSLVILEGMGTFHWLHCGVVDGIELDGHLVGLNRLKRPGNKHEVCLLSGGTGHGDRWQ